MSRWLQKTSWRFSSRVSRHWTWDLPTQTLAWLWPAYSPSSTAPLPASSVHRLTVSAAFTPSKQNKTKHTMINTRGGGLTPALHLPTKCKHFLFSVWYPLTHVSTHKLLTHWLCSNNRCSAYQHLTLWHTPFWSSCCNPLQNKISPQ